MSHAQYLPLVGTPASGSQDCFTDLTVVSTVNITAVLHGKIKRAVSIAVPRKMTCLELKRHLADQGVVSSSGGLCVLSEEEGPVLADSEDLEVEEGQVMHLRSASPTVSVMVLATEAAALQGHSSDEDIYELVLPSETSGAALKGQVEEATAGALRPLAIFMPSGEDSAPAPLADDAAVFLEDNQILVVQCAPQSAEASASAPQAAQPQAARPQDLAIAGGRLSGLRSRLLRGRRGSKGEPAGLCLRAASALKVRGSHLCCTSKDDWASCAVFDVSNPGHFEVTVQLTEDAPVAEAPGLAGRWMLGVVPAAVAEVRTEKQRKTLVGLGYFITVCHGHPAKIHAPSMPRGTCGEDVHALPGELRKGQRLALRFVAAKTGGTLEVQVDDGDSITLPYAPAPFDDVRPCLAFGSGPAELRVLQLEGGGGAGGA